MKNVLMKGQYAQSQFAIQSIHQNEITTKTSTQSLAGGQ